MFLKMSYSSLANQRQFAYHIFLRKREGFVSLSGDGITFPPIHRHNPYPSNPFGEHIPFQGFSEIVYFLLSQDNAPHHIVSLQLTTAKNRRQLATLTAVKNTTKGTDIKRSQRSIFGRFPVLSNGLMLSSLSLLHFTG
jgi:hypothetical protein